MSSHARLTYENLSPLPGSSAVFSGRCEPGGLGESEGGLTFPGSWRHDSSFLAKLVLMKEGVRGETVTWEPEKGDLTWTLT